LTLRENSRCMTILLLPPTTTFVVRSPLQDSKRFPRAGDQSHGTSPVESGNITSWSGWGWLMLREQTKEPLCRPWLEGRFTRGDAGRLGEHQTTGHRVVGLVIAGRMDGGRSKIMVMVVVIDDSPWKEIHLSVAPARRPLRDVAVLWLRRATISTSTSLGREMSPSEVQLQKAIAGH
jgi:hypothetical protein